MREVVVWEFSDVGVDEEEEEEKEEEEKEKQVVEEKKKVVKKSESLIIQDGTTSHTSSLPRSQSHHAAVQSATSHLSGQPHTPGEPVLPVIGHQRSKSYQLMLGEERGEGGRESGDAKLGKESRTTSRSQSDISEEGGVAGVGIDSNLRMRKSGVVIGPSSRGSAQRPSLEVFESAEEREKGRGRRSKGEREGRDVTDGPQVVITPSGNNGESCDSHVTHTVSHTTQVR